MYRLGPLLLRLVLFTLILLLFACGGSKTDVQETPLPVQEPDTTFIYNGPAASTDDVQNFRLNLWDNIATPDRCGACHVQDNQTPQFARNDDINLAYSVANTLVNSGSPSESLLVTKVAAGHNCWLSSDATCADLMTTWISGWLNTDDTANQIELDAPSAVKVGETKNFPEDNTLFVTNVYPLLSNYCGDCHRPSVTVPISPYFASSDTSEAYSAAIAVLDIDSPEDSRVVERIRDEFHNCWGDCANNATELSLAIGAMSEAIELTALDANLLASDSMNLFAGTLASGGGRYENNLIAKWEFKAMSGATAYDTSGISPALDLTLSGDYEWLSGGGIQFIDGKAQGSTANSAKLYNLLSATGEFSLELWVTPGNVTQEGPARIMTYSGSNDTRNFMLGQTLYNYDYSVRNNATNSNGEPFGSTPDDAQVLQSTLQHVVVNYSSTSGKTLYVNGELVSEADNLEASLLSTWDESFAFALANEVSGQYPFSGTLRMIAIHNRELAPTQIMSNFDAGIGDRYFVLFGVSEIVDLPLTYVVFEISQFDAYSYLFSSPFVVSLDDSVDLSGLAVSGIRIGINAREESAGQVYANLNVTLDTTTTNDFGGVNLSRLGTVLPIDQGVELDQFFLTFETLGEHTSIRVVTEAPTVAAPVNLEPQSLVGIRHFAEINAAMSNVTGVSRLNDDVVATYSTLQQQLPSVSDINTFLTSNQMAITQLAIKYCDVLVEDTTLRQDFFGELNVNTDINSGVPSEVKAGITTTLINRVIGQNIATQPNVDAVTDELNSLIDTLTRCSDSKSCPSNALATTVKATCAATLGSAALTLQ